MNYIIYCASIIIIAICDFNADQAQAKAKPAMIEFNTDGIVIDSVDRDRNLEGYILETIELREASERKPLRMLSTANEDFYDYSWMTEEEQKMIEETMEKYK